jgi:hypothetical protein
MINERVLRSTAGSALAATLGVRFVFWAIFG